MLAKWYIERPETTLGPQGILTVKSVCVNYTMVGWPMESSWRSKVATMGCGLDCCLIIWVSKFKTPYLSYYSHCYGELNHLSYGMVNLAVFLIPYHTKIGFMYLDEVDEPTMRLLNDILEVITDNKCQLISLSTPRVTSHLHAQLCIFWRNYVIIMSAGSLWWQTINNHDTNYVGYTHLSRGRIPITSPSHCRGTIEGANIDSCLHRPFQHVRCKVFTFLKMSLVLCVCHSTGLWCVIRTRSRQWHDPGSSNIITKEVKHIQDVHTTRSPADFYIHIFIMIDF